MSPHSTQVVAAMQLLVALPSWSKARGLYEKGSVLGSGSFATVYAAQVTETNTPVALKQISLRKAAPAGGQQMISGMGIQWTQPVRFSCSRHCNVHTRMWCKPTASTMTSKELAWSSRQSLAAGV